jgi:hypothetical protein
MSFAYRINWHIAPPHVARARQIPSLSRGLICQSYKMSEYSLSNQQYSKQICLFYLYFDSKDNTMNIDITMMLDFEKFRLQNS